MVKAFPQDKNSITDQSSKYHLAGWTFQHTLMLDLVSIPR
jgi:hypothetical protein